jgi:ribosomal protein L13
MVDNQVVNGLLSEHKEGRHQIKDIIVYHTSKIPVRSQFAIVENVF